MRLTAIALLSACAFLGLALGSSSAQTPTVQVYFDEDLLWTIENCPGVGVVDTVYFVAENFNAYIVGIEYLVIYSPGEGYVTWLTDFGFGTAIPLGSTPEGISLGWPLPQNAYEPLLVHKALIIWNCSFCSQDDFIKVRKHPIFGYIRAVRWPDYEFIVGTWANGYICAQPPVEDRTWGYVKALFDG